jgi:hypothetical protein
MEAARKIFYGIYGDSGQSSSINDLLRHLGFHALSITLLATATSHNAWDHGLLVKGWDVHRAQVLQTDYSESLAATIELSLSSPTFLSLGPNTRDLLGFVTFFPQGVNENNLDWLFPTISNGKNIFDKFCVLSLTYRSNGFITMLAPIREYLSPQDPRSSSLLCATKITTLAGCQSTWILSSPGLKRRDGLCWRTRTSSICLTYLHPPTQTRVIPGTLVITL